MLHFLEITVKNIKQFLLRVNLNICKGALSTLSVSSFLPDIQDNLFYN